MNSKIKVILTAGFAMFSMFFGSGNLVYPLKMGTETLDQFLAAAGGLTLSAVFVPFLGLLAIILFQGNRKAFFQTIGKFPAIIITFIILALLGPIGVVPRCILVAYGSIQNIFPETDFLIPFSATFSLLTLLLIWNHHRVIPILGRLLTPWLLLGIITVIITGLYSAPIAESTPLQEIQAFSIGFHEGYQTMDLLAAFFFSAAIVEYLRNHHYIENNPSSLITICSSASLLAAGLLALIYMGFIALGAYYAPALANTPPEQMLVAISKLSIGNIALPIVAITASLACLTTATILSMQFAEFFSSEITQGKLKRHPSIFLTLFIAFLISLEGFSSLTLFLGKILTYAYPALVALTIASILCKSLPALPKKLPGLVFYLTLTINLIM